MVWIVLFLILYFIQYNLFTSIFPVHSNKYLKSRARVYCGIPTTVKRQSWWYDIMDTWGQHCDVIKFFISHHEDDISVPNSIGKAEVVRLPMVRKPGEGLCGNNKPCRHISEKTWRMWSYIFENNLNEADYFLKIDDDTFFIAEKFKHFVKDSRITPNQARYFGHKVWPRDKPFQIISGVCTALTQEAVRRLGVRLQTIKHEYGPRANFPHSSGKCVDRDGATEELVIAKCLEETGVYAEASLEDDTKETVIPLGIPFTLTYKRKHNTTGWVWNGKPQSRGDREDCCSHKYTFGIHGYKGAGQHLRNMYNMVYEMSDYEVKERLEHRKPELLRFILGIRENINL